MPDFKASRGQGEVSDPAEAGAKAGGPAKNKRRADNRSIEVGPFPDVKAIPGQKGDEDVAKAMHEQIMAELADLPDEEIDALYEEIMEELDDEDLDDEDFDDEDYEDDEDDVQVEDPFADLPNEIEEAFKITNADLDLSEFDTALNASGQNLSEDFKVGAKNIFESVITKTINDRLSVIAEAVTEFAREALLEKEEAMVATLDRTLDEVILEWLEQNEVAIEGGLKADIAEHYMSRFRDLLQECGATIDEDKIDVAQTLAHKNDELTEKVNALWALKEEQDAELEMYRKRDVIMDVCDGLTESEMQKVYALVENMEFQNEKQFTKLVEDVRAVHFTGGPKTSNNGSRMITEDALHTNTGGKTAVAHNPVVQATFAALGNAKK